MIILAKREEKGIKQAAALKYSPGSEGAPKIIALGKGVIAEQIMSKAKEHNVPLYNDPNLAEVLNTLRIGDEIPEELYEVVASVLVFVSNLDKKYGKKYSK
jgi:flagellar biosynthesis protein